MESAVFAILFAKKLGAKQGKVLQHIATVGFPKRMRKGMASVLWTGDEESRIESVKLHPFEGMKLWEIASSVVSEENIPEDIPETGSHTGSYLKIKLN